MTSRVLTVDTETPLKEIVRIMKKTGYQRLPVTDKDRLVGIVTQTCIISVMDRCL
ncbi:MAG: CBS domain-containing protein [Candidatus Hydrothermarchaeaceae archaeon]